MVITGSVVLNNCYMVHEKKKQEIGGGENKRRRSIESQKNAVDLSD